MYEEVLRVHQILVECNRDVANIGFTVIHNYAYRKSLLCV